MRNKLFRRTMVGVICLSMLVSAMPGNMGGIGVTRVAKADSSKEILSFSSKEKLVPENAKTVSIPVVREGNTDKARKVTIAVYDISTNYGDDYRVYYDGKEADRITGSTSMFDAFRDKSTVVMKDAEAASLLGSDSIEAATDIEKGCSALDDIGARAAGFDVYFEKGETEKKIEIKVADDDLSEYDETLVLGAFSEDENVEDGIATVCIQENDKLAVNTISIDSKSMKLKEDEKTAEVYFKRTGNLAAISKAVLYKDEKPYGYINYVPYQSEQMTMLPAGTYHLVSNGETQVGSEVIVIDDADVGKKTKKEQKEKLDNLGLDDVPEYAEYKSGSGTDKVGKNKKNAAPEWFPDWAVEGKSKEENTYKVVMGSIKTGSDGKDYSDLFKQGGHSGYGTVYYKKDTNELELNNEGTWSACQEGYVFADAKNNSHKEDFTGYEAVESRVCVDGLNRDAQLALGVYQIKADEHNDIHGNQTVDLRVNLPPKNQSSAYVWYRNTDPSISDDGCRMYFPNGYKMVKRPYAFRIADSTTINFYDESGALKPVSFGTLQTVDQIAYITEDRQNPKDASIVQVNVDYGKYYGSVTGYKVRNFKTLTESDPVSIGSGTNIILDRDFLNKYENTYAEKTNGAIGHDGEYYMFEIIPVVDKQYVTTEIDASNGGEILLDSGDAKLGKGDYAIISSKNIKDGYSFVGVDVYYKKASTDNWSRKTLYPSNGKVKLYLDGENDNYRFQGVFTTEKNQISVNYAPGAKEHGTLLSGTDGVVVPADEYVVNEYAPLMAKPDDGYVTRWTSNTRNYYGNVFYYQLDGSLTNDVFSVDFIPESTLGVTKQTVKGTCNINRVNLSDNTQNYLEPLAGKTVTIVADKAYTFKVADDGSFEIPDFKGVYGGTYCASVPLDNSISYLQFTYDADKNTLKPLPVDLVVPEFSGMAFYPQSVAVALNNVPVTSNKVTLDTNKDVMIQVSIKKNTTDCNIEKVKFHFYRSDENGKKYNELFVADAEYVPPNTITEYGTNDAVTYGATIPTSQIPSWTYLYVEGIGTRKVFYSETVETVVSQEEEESETFDTVQDIEVSTGEVDTGFRFSNELLDTTIPAYSDIPAMPGAQDGASIVDFSVLSLDFLGFLDMSISGKGGGYFVSQQIDPYSYYLVAGFNMVDFWTPSVADNHEAAVQTKSSFDQAKSKGETGVGDTKDTAVNTTTDTASKTEKGKKPSKGPTIHIAPTFMIRFMIRGYLDDKGDQHMYVAALDVAIGVDEVISQNFPFNIYGVPLYVNVKFTGEQYAMYSQTFKNDEFSKVVEDQDMNKLNIDSQKVYIELSNMNLTVKGGLGYNNLAGVYLAASVNPRLLVEYDLNKNALDAGANLSGTIGAGADVAIFNLAVNIKLPALDVGNKDLCKRIHVLNENNATKSLKTESNPDFGLAEGDGSTADIVSKMNQSTFGAVRDLDNDAENKDIYSQAKAVLATDTNTLIEKTARTGNVHLVQLDGGKIMALALQDNGAPESSFNYYSVVTSISSDGGKNWSKPQTVSDSKLLQYNVKAHEVDDNHILVTWSEGDMDAVMKGKNFGDGIKSNEVAKALNAFNLKARFYKKDGTPDGEAFELVNDSGVSASMLQTVKRDNLVYVYYQRCKYDTNKNMKPTDLLSKESTFSYVTVDTAAGNKVTMSNEQILAKSKDGSKAYMITEIKPFEFKGIIGDIIVIDRDGKLVKTDSKGNEFPSIDDRQIFLRVNADKDGKLKQGDLIPLTDETGCAQSIALEYNKDHIYLFYNDNGTLRAYRDFIMTKKDYDAAVAANNGVEINVPAVVNTDLGTVTVSTEQEAYTPMSVCADEDSLTPDSKLASSMDSDGDIMLTWIGSNSARNKELWDEVYGVMMKANTDGSLKVTGSPVAITDFNKVLNSIDNVALSDQDYLLAYTMLDGDSVLNSNRASVMTSRAKYQSDVEIVSVDAPDYPTPGTQATAQVTVVNNGIKPAKNVTVSAAGLPAAQTPLGASDDGRTELDPGESRTVDVLIDIPGDFDKNTTVTFTAAADDSSNNMQKEFKFGSYFVPEGLPYIDNITNTKNFKLKQSVRNIGNKAGVPKITYCDAVKADPDPKSHHEGTIEGNKAINPGDTGDVTGEMTNTVADNDKLVTVVVKTGDGYDQAVETVMPECKTAGPTASETYGLAEGKTFTSGNFKYKVTKEAGKDQKGKVKLIGLTSKGKKASKLEMKKTVKLSAKEGAYKEATYTIKSLGKGAFKGAKAAKIKLNKKITEIPKEAFVKCKKLKKLIIQEKLEKVAKKAFKGCKKKITVTGASKKKNKHNMKLIKKSGYKKVKTG